MLSPKNFKFSVFSANLLLAKINFKFRKLVVGSYFIAYGKYWIFSLFSPNLFEDKINFKFWILLGKFFNP